MMPNYSAYQIILLVLLSLNSFAQTRMYLVAGQSNARGRGDSPQSPEVGLYGKEYKYNDDTTVQLTDPVGENILGFQSANSGSFLPAFVNSFHENTGLDIVMVHAAKGGTSLLPSADLFGMGNWSASGSIFGNAVTKADAAMSHTGLNLSGIIWLQGEMEGLAITSSTTYKDALQDLISRFRTEFGEDLPFFIIEIGPYNGPESNVKAHFDVIRGVQREVASEDSNTFIVYNKSEQFIDLGWMKDEFHYKQDAYNDIGEVVGDSIPKFNVAPSPFSTDLPANDETIVLQKKDSIQFSWQQAKDRDQLKYILNINSSSTELSIEVIGDTSIYFKDTDLLESGTRYDWNVAATDGIDTVESVDSKTFQISVITNIKNNYEEPNFYPNPARNKVYFKNYDNRQVCVYDLHGNQIGKTSLTQNSNMDVTHLAKGAYLIKFDNDRTYRLIIN